MSKSIETTPSSLRRNICLARRLYPHVSPESVFCLRNLLRQLPLSIGAGELILLDDSWYVTHSGLLKIAALKKCAGIATMVQTKLCNPVAGSWVFKAVVYKTRSSKGFIGFGDANPTNVSSKIRGSEMRVAETRAVNRALRKAYAIGICSFEELGPQRNGASPTLHRESAISEPATLRRRLCSLISNYGLNAAAVKRYAAEFCGTHEVREATRELVEDFIEHLSLSLTNDRKAVIEHLKQYETGGVQ